MIRSPRISSSLPAVAFGYGGHGRMIVERIFLFLLFCAVPAVRPEGPIRRATLAQGDREKRLSAIALATAEVEGYEPTVPRISIITSIYKGEKFIKHFLQEITKQTVFKDCELILINANSPEDEEKIIKPYLKKYKNIIYKKLQNRVTIYSAWNEAIKLASGEYITNANLDDRLDYKCYETYLNYLDKNPDIDLVYADGYETDKINISFHSVSGACPSKLAKSEDLDKRSRKCFAKQKLSNHKIYKPEFSKTNLRHNCLPSFYPMWRANLHNKFGLFNDNFTIAGDWEFWVRIANGGSKFKKIPGVYGLAYHNPIGLSTNLKTLQLKDKEKAIVRNMHKDFFTN